MEGRKQVKMTLPEAFLENMKRLLGDEYDAFLASFEGERKNALRVNRLKLTPDEFEAVSPFALEKVPWTENGYYVDYRQKPGQHAFYRAGLYYLQEPSAMAPAQILPVQPGDRVLDLCAAPGGKATELGERLKGEGVLVANEISSSRAKALQHNIELSGIRNCIVTNESPHSLAGRFGEYFDRILVDAPCSGEGMFRKNPEAVSTWSLEKVSTCAGIQREILSEAAGMLRPGGYLVYSTCTFEPEENELAVADLLEKREDLELVEIPCTEGRESFSKAYSLKQLFDLREEEDGEGNGQENRLIRSRRQEKDLTCAVRIWPHHAEGEGHFIALLRRKKEAGREGPRHARLNQAGPEQGRLNQSGPRHARLNQEGSDLEWAQAGSLDAGRPEQGSRNRGRKIRPDRRSERPGQGADMLQERRFVREFLERYDPDLNIDDNRCKIRAGRAYLLPENSPDLRGLRFLRAGMYLGDIKKNRFEPSQELALSLPVPDSGCIRFPAEDTRLTAFLRGETLRLSKQGQGGQGQNGWVLVCAGRWPVGWGKLVDGVLKNHIPPAWRASLR